MNLVEVVILVGAQCLSPLETAPGLTDAGKVHCAVLIRQDPETSDVEIVPQAAATDPEVIAMLVKPRIDAAVLKADRLAAQPAADDITGSVTPAPPLRIVPTSAEAEPAPVTPKAKPIVRKKVTKPGVNRKRAGVARASDTCGSYRAVWYTNKDGRRKYRCVKSG